MKLRPNLPLIAVALVSIVLPARSVPLQGERYDHGLSIVGRAGRPPHLQRFGEPVGLDILRLRSPRQDGLRGPWWQGYENETVNALIKQAQATLPDGERRAIYRRIYSLARDDAPWIFLYRPTDYWGVGPALKDWEPRADGLLIF